MSLIQINLHNKAFTNDGRFYLVRRVEQRVEVIDATCSHRNGPLIYGEVSSSTPEIIKCPWHKSITSKKVLCNKIVPVIRIENDLLIILKKIDFRILNYGITSL